VPIETGTRLGQYVVQDFVGQGAMGLVYRAYHAELERTGAVKVMQAITPDVDTVARFRHEAQAIAQLRHPNIVQVYDFGEFGGTPYMVVEYIPGGSLAARMARGPLDQETSLKYLRGIAAGLDYAHNHGVVHRDVKPANVLLTAEDTPVLADFGLAKLLQGSSLKSMTGVTTGTPAYMAPEQVMGQNVGPAADRYSLATIAYEMMTGVIPFDGEGLMELLYAQVHREPPAPSWRNPELGPRVDAVVMQGLAKDPSARWTSATAFVDALEAATATHRPATASPTAVLAAPSDASAQAVARTEVVERPAAPRAPAEDVTLAYPSPPPTPPRPKRRLGGRLIAALAGAVALVLLMGVCAVQILPGGLQVSPDSAAPGELVTVTASRVPANQAGQVQMLSVLHTYPFRANARGNVREQIRVPLDVEVGMHTVKLCWQGACHRSTQLRVVAGAAIASPAPADGNSPAPSLAVTPTPSLSPHPTATATVRSSPTPTVRSSSKPSPKPVPTPSPTPYFYVNSVSATLNTSVTLYYYPAWSATVKVCQDLQCYTVIGPVTIPAGTNTVTFKTPIGVKPTDSLLGFGQASVVICTNACRPSANSVPVLA
jgi:Protein kinase domain